MKEAGQFLMLVMFQDLILHQGMLQLKTASANLEMVLINTLFPLMTSFPSSVLLTSLLPINMLSFYLFCFSSTLF
jgi:hypothetical protein